MAQTTFKVTGETKIHCASCEQRVDRALSGLDGVSDVKASFQTQEVTVTIDDAKLTPEQVREKLEQLGYETSAAGRAG
jgi:copper chaperone CopZ